MHALYESLSLHQQDERDRRKMQLVPWLLHWFVWRAMGTMRIQRFLPTNDRYMKIASPISELFVGLEIQCAFACTENSMCFSYSVTKASGVFLCRLGGNYDEPRTSDDSSTFFYKELTGYTNVPGTQIYVKMTVKNITPMDAATACQNEGAQLLSSNNAAVNAFMTQLWRRRPSGTYFWVGGRSVAVTGNWVFPDGIVMVMDQANRKNVRAKISPLRGSHPPFSGMKMGSKGWTWRTVKNGERGAAAYSDERALSFWGSPKVLGDSCRRVRASLPRVGRFKINGHPRFISGVTTHVIAGRKKLDLSSMEEIPLILFFPRGSWPCDVEWDFFLILTSSFLSREPHGQVMAKSWPSQD
ncbi:unnamed protein product [Darwinula stevensoni]|uniref:C-type lectin domain-containing protein n=1 Tax=Darwinula stevensoni TaxID=69355 RepID=A0A7R9A4Q4_9CRUS|nr:unnamed protein product [Darwinula stevensoni]CAG0890476.1 unnamed protein product [Darwinula stevensoni]